MIFGWRRWAHCMKRYEGTRQFASKKPSGGVGLFRPIISRSLILCGQMST